jgi:HSP20 family protein
MFTRHVHDLHSLQNEVHRLLSSNMSDAFADEGIARGAWNPTMDIYENKDGIVIKGDLPGMNREDIHLTFENNVLTLSGERRFEKDEADNYHRVECSYGTFTRSFAVQQTESIEGVTAAYNNGILRIDLPKREEVKARRIDIVEGEARGIRTIEAQPEKAPATDQKATAQAARG